MRMREKEREREKVKHCCFVELSRIILSYVKHGERGEKERERIELESEKYIFSSLIFAP